MCSTRCWCTVRAMLVLMFSVVRAVGVEVDADEAVVLSVESGGSGSGSVIANCGS